MSVDAETRRVSSASQGRSEGPRVPDLQAPPASVDASLIFRGKYSKFSYLYRGLILMPSCQRIETKTQLSTDFAAIAYQSADTQTTSINTHVHINRHARKQKQC